MHTFGAIAMQEYSKYIRIWKPLLDRLMALILCLLMLPLLFIIALLLKLSGFPVFFKHLRPGYKGKLFFLWKFTTMRDGEVTRLGSVLRKSSLDELPQLFNILKGEMSFVGPRPLLIEYMETYDEEQRRRHDVKPGVTGWAQVNGRNALSLQTKICHDLEYVEKIGFWFDLRILLMTIRKVFYYRQADYHAIQ